MSKLQKKSATDSQPPPNPGSRPQFEDHRLRYVYSVIEIATLAAGCRADTLEERVEEAVQLLSAVERSAALSKDQKERDILDESLTRKFKEVPTPR